ncbi:MAG: hypothetical protein DWQ04_30565 [Chloroflexi bacterium]|nr:MAG: hypothetical protein DWQ04_30565 [Chloroflexota bacterium]
MDGSKGEFSPALLAAQQYLLERRRQLTKNKKRKTENGKRLTDDRSPFTSLLAHLGWGSEALTAVLRNHSPQEQDNLHNEQVFDEDETAVSHPAPSYPTITPQAQTVKLYPDIARGMLRQEQAAAGRLWLLCRSLDGAGQGWFRIANLRRTLTTDTSSLRVCGWRQLRNLLNQGNGIFWTRDKERIWLKSAAHVAANLRVEKLTGKPVSVPVKALTGKIGQVRAQLYAAFHSGRARAAQRQPIARDTLAELTGVGRRTQLAYESLTGMAVQHNYAIGAPYSAETAEKHAWHQGQATFVFQDSHGTQGRPGRSYIAWQLPNSYGGCHPHVAKGRQRRINRKLADLVTKGAPGNNKERFPKRYYPDGKQAVKTASRHPEWAVYWWRQRAGNGRSDLWQQI